MAIQKPQGSQLDIQDISAAIAADPTAISSFDAEYVRNDGANYSGIVDGEVLVFTVGSPSGFVNRLLLETDISDLQSYLLPSDIGTSVQAWKPALENIATLLPVDGDVMIAEGSPLMWDSRALTTADLSDGSTIVTAAGYGVDLSAGSPPPREATYGSPAAVYTNATGAPLTLMVRVGVGSIPSAIEVDGFVVSSFAVYSLGSPENTLEATHSVLVPYGSTYELVGDGVLLSWYEVQ